MSEFQYYEFQAIDRPLTETQMRELRKVSTRARITPTSFINHYEWGDFKGDPTAWVEQYFDAFLYFANWGTRELMLRLPARRLDLKTARQYCNRDSASAHLKDDKLILTFRSENDWGDDAWLELEGLLSSLAAVRSELKRGDLRALYLGWLLGAWADEREDEELEPPVPSGLGQLSNALEGLAEFLRLDQNLLFVASQASAPLNAAPTRDEVLACVSSLPTQEKDDLLMSLLMEGDQDIAADLLNRIQRSRSGGRTEPAMPRRTVGEMLKATEVRRMERQGREAKRRSQEQARRDQEAASAREQYLAGLEGHETELWAEVEALVSTKQPKKYAEAIEHLIDLRDLAARTPNGDFPHRIETLRQAHDRKPAFLERLGKAGF